MEKLTSPNNRYLAIVLPRGVTRRLVKPLQIIFIKFSHLFGAFPQQPEPARHEYQLPHQVVDSTTFLFPLWPKLLEEYKKALDLSDIHGEESYSTNERNSIRPSLDVNGIWGGYIGEGAKTVIASKAYAKISMRLVPHQDSKKITQLFKKYFER